MFKTSIYFVFLLIIQFQAANAKGVSPYLPLQTDPVIELQIERLTTIAQMPILTKPYHIVTLVKYLSKIRHSHPRLYQRLTQYIKRYKKQGAITQFSNKISHTNKEEGYWDNSRGEAVTTQLQTNIAGFYQFNQYAIANLGGAIYDGKDFTKHNSYLSLGTEYIQFDIGYREHWLAPLQESALTVSTNAEPAPSITVSNVTPITSWNIKYEMSLATLAEMEGIHFNNSTSKGSPGFLTMQMSIQPFSWWTLGGVRTFMFAGGQRSVDASTIWKAIIDPISGDNCGGESELQDCDLESGNQIAAITSKFDFSFNKFPINLMLEYGGEDAKDYQYSLGNIGRSYAIFLPHITSHLALYAEYSEFHQRWYVHHLYDEGYRNDGAVMGHWWANNKAMKDISGGNATTVRVNWDIEDQYHLQVKYKTAYIEPSADYQYHRTKEVAFELSQVYKQGFLNYSLTLGKDINAKSYFKIAFGYNW